MTTVNIVCAYFSIPIFERQRIARDLGIAFSATDKVADATTKAMVSAKQFGMLEKIGHECAVFIKKNRPDLLHLIEDNNQRDTTDTTVGKERW